MCGANMTTMYVVFHPRLVPLHSLSALKFKALNSELNKEVADFERSQRSGAHTLSDGPVYSPTASSSTLELESEAHSHLLGGSPSTLSDAREDRRRLALEAAIRRIRKEEEELEHTCGTAGPP